MGIPKDDGVLLAPNGNALAENVFCAGFDVVDLGAADGKLDEPKSDGAADAGAPNCSDDGVALKPNDGVADDWPLVLFVPKQNAGAVAGADVAATFDNAFVASVLLLLLLLPNAFAVLFGWPKRNGVVVSGAAGAVAASVGALNKFGSFDTSVLGRFNEIDLVLSSVAVGVTNENIGFGFSPDGAGWINTFSRTVTPCFCSTVVGADGVAVSVTSDVTVAGEPNFGDPNVGADEPKPN